MLFDLMFFSPAACSAFAGFGSFACAASLLRIHSLNRADSVRPELVISKISREDQTNASVIKVESITNEGKGVALHVRGQLVNAMDGLARPLTGPPSFVLCVEPILLLPPSKPIDANWDGRIFWLYADLIQDSLFLQLEIYCLDIHNRLHTFIFHILAVQNTTNHVVAGMAEMAPGLFLSRREHRIQSAWWTRFRVRLARLRNSLKGLVTKQK